MKYFSLSSVNAVFWWHVLIPFGFYVYILKVMVAWKEKLSPLSTSFYIMAAVRKGMDTIIFNAFVCPAFTYKCFTCPLSCLIVIIKSLAIRSDHRNVMASNSKMRNEEITSEWCWG